MALPSSSSHPMHRSPSESQGGEKSEGLGVGGGIRSCILLSFPTASLGLAKNRHRYDRRPELANLLGLCSWTEEGRGKEAFQGRYFQSHLPSRSLGCSVRSLAARWHPWEAHQELGWGEEEQRYESRLGKRKSPMFSLFSSWAGEKGDAHLQKRKTCVWVPWSNRRVYVSS